MNAKNYYYFYLPKDSFIHSLSHHTNHVEFDPENQPVSYDYDDNFII